MAMRPRHGNGSSVESEDSQAGPDQKETPLEYNNSRGLTWGQLTQGGGQSPAVVCCELGVRRWLDSSFGDC